VADEESVDVVIMRRETGGRQTTPLFSDRLVDLDSPDVPVPEALADLLESTVRLVAPTDVPFGVVDLVRQMPAPEAFQALGLAGEAPRAGRRGRRPLSSGVTRPALRA
jgi:hypothetical protein